MSQFRSLRTFLSRPIVKVALAVLSVLCAAPSSCGGGGGGLPGENYVVPDPTTQMLLAGDVNNVIYQVANDGPPAIVAVVDRVGNVLAVAQVGGGPPSAGNSAATCPAPTTCTLISSGEVIGTPGLEGTLVPTTFAAISKAITAAYLSSGGNAFTTRTANEIIQQHFPPGILGTPGGPLFGVQFSQLACSDLIQGPAAKTAVEGPHAAPLGLSADPGGLPLYKNGVVVGGVGVMTTDSYSINTSRLLSSNTDEAVALAAQTGYGPPPVIEAPDIIVNGVELDYIGPTLTPSTSTAVAPFVLLAAAPFYAGAAVLAGQQYGNPGSDSGILPDAAGTIDDPHYSIDFPNLHAFVLVEPGAPFHNRYDPHDAANAAKAPTDGNAITANEAEALVGNALSVALQTRAGIRIPENSNAQVTASVVDLDGNILAIARLSDAPIFGIDVSLQKARSAVFFSRIAGDINNAYNKISGLPAAPGARSTPGNLFSYYMQTQAAALGVPNVFNSGTAFSEVAIGNLARPFYPDGQDGQPNGPLSLAIGTWSPFSTGLQTDLVYPDLAAILGGAAPPAAGCGTNAHLTPPAAEAGLTPAGETKTQIANGLQIFSGGFPVYRGNELIGALGISGDGIQQDALIAYIGIQGDGSIGVSGVPTVRNAPAAIRADNVVIEGSRLIYVTCPVAPFISSQEQNPCS